MPPAAWGSSRSEGDGQEPHNSALFPLGLPPGAPLRRLRPNRGPGFGASPRPHLWPGPRLSGPQGRACRPPPQTGFSALQGSVGTSPFNSLFLFFSGALFCGEGAEGGGFLPLPRARARQVSCPKAGLGAPSGRKWGRVHPRGGACGRGAPVSRACESCSCPSPRALLPLVPPTCSGAARRGHLQSHPGADSSRGRHAETSLLAVKESGGLERSPVIYSVLLASLLCDLGQLLRPLWATFFRKTREPMLIS